MKLNRIHLAIAAASMIAAGCSSTPGQRGASADKAPITPDHTGSAVAVVPQSRGDSSAAARTDGAMARETPSTLTPYSTIGSGQPVPTKAPPPNILVPATGSGEGSDTANSNVPTGESTGAGAAGSGTALPNLGRSSETIVVAAQNRALDQRQMSELIGANVRNPQGERIGKIEEVLLDANGQPSIAIVSTGGFLGVGDSKHAVPFAALQLANNGSTDRMLDISREQLRQAPTLSGTQRPDMSDRGWMEQNSRAYGRP